MPHIPFDHINYWAVLVAGIATFFLGAVWYMALFGKLWCRLSGFSPEKQKEMQTAGPPHVFFGTMIGSYLVLSWVVAVLAAWIGVSTAMAGSALGFFLWLGPALCIGLTSYIANDRKFGVYVIDLAYQLVFLVMTGAIVGGWHR